MYTDPNPTVVEFGEEQNISTSKIRYPFAAIFHVLFRFFAIFVYLLSTWITGSFITSFIIILLLLAMDFWTIKNITGRLLVGLRWWNFVDENGQNHWIFESRKDNMGRPPPTTSELQLFWIVLVISPLIWVFLFFGALFTLKFRWLVIVCLGVLLNGANLYGYIRCRVGNNTQIKSSASDFFYSKLVGNFISSSIRGNKSTNPAPAPPPFTT